MQSFENRWCAYHVEERAGPGRAEVGRIFSTADFDYLADWNWNLSNMLISTQKHAIALKIKAKYKS